MNLFRNEKLYTKMYYLLVQFCENKCKNKLQHRNKQCSKIKFILTTSKLFARIHSWNFCFWTNAFKQLQTVSKHTAPYSHNIIDFTVETKDISRHLNLFNTVIDTSISYAHAALGKLIIYCSEATPAFPDTVRLPRDRSR